MKEPFAVASLILGFATFVPYYLEMWRGTAKPHIFSWIPWTAMTGIAFWLSFTNGGGSGAWLFLLQSLLCGIVLVYALFRGERNITTFDRYTFAGTIFVLFLYLVTKNAIISTILAASVDTSAFIPTFRKSFMKPWEEPTLTYFLSGLSFFFAILAIEYFSFVTVFYATCLVLSNFAFVAFALIRRRTLKNRRSSI